jgi:glycosyltransferase involved in cell wall biosynthesis
MNIVHVIPGDLWAGAEAQVYYTIMELNKFNKHKIFVILFCKGELYFKLSEENVNVIFLDENECNSISLCNKIKKKIIESDADIVHTHEYKSHILSSIALFFIKKKRIKLFRTLHGLNVANKFKSKVVLYLQNLFLRYRTDHIIAVSEELFNYFRVSHTRAKVHLIYNAIELSKAPSRNDINNIRSKYGVSENKIWIGTAARLESIKNIEMLIETEIILKNKFPELEFYISIFGDGSLYEYFASSISQRGLTESVKLEGHVRNIIDIMKSLDIFTLTSKSEGLPMSLLEAMSVGTIPVCTAVGGMKEIINDGENGFLVTPNDAEALANRIFNIYKTPQKDLEEMGKKSREHIKLKFSVQKNCHKLLLAYDV